MASVNPLSASSPSLGARQAQMGVRSALTATRGQPATPTSQTGGTRNAAVAKGVSLTPQSAAPSPTKSPQRSTPPPTPQVAPATPGLAGDVDGDGHVSATDGQALLAHLFEGRELPGGLQNADANGDGTVDIADAMSLLHTHADAAEEAASEPTPALVGDVDGDGEVGAADGHALLSHLFEGESFEGLKNADVNGDGVVDIADAVSLFSSGNDARSTGPKAEVAVDATPEPTPPQAPPAPSPVSFLQAQARSSYGKTLGLLAVSQRL